MKNLHHPFTWLKRTTFEWKYSHLYFDLPIFSHMVANLCDPTFWHKIYSHACLYQSESIYVFQLYHYEIYLQHFIFQIVLRKCLHSIYWIYGWNKSIFFRSWRGSVDCRQLEPNWRTSRLLPLCPSTFIVTLCHFHLHHLYFNLL